MVYFKNNLMGREINICIFKLFFIPVLFFHFIPPALSQQRTKIEIINAESLEYDDKIGKDVKRLLGNVQFKQDNAIMYCDSAYFSPDNVIDAFNNIKIVQGDSLTLTGDTLHYDGNTRVARVRGGVELVHNKTHLKTHFLDYDRAKDVGYYFNHGTIVDKDNENTLNSNRGYYHSKKYEFFSIDSVSMVNKDYSMYSDTLKYNTRSKISYFFGPTVIRNDSGYIYCENGWYNTETEISQYNKNAYIVNKSHKLKGDSLFYDQNKKYGKAFMNVELYDTTEKMMIRGNYAYFQEKPKKALVTDKALYIYALDTGKNQFDSMYVHADTIRLDVFPPDTFKVLRAYHHVKIFKSDLQGKCDSMYYTEKDSVIRLFSDPVIWSDENQMTADSIRIYSKDGNVNKVVMTHKALISSEEDSSKYNQMKGKIIVGYVVENELNRIEIEGNGQSVYYIKDEKSYIGVNKAECSRMTIFRKDKKFDRIMFISKPEATLYPVDKVSRSDIFLKDFTWLDKHRPYTWRDVFRWEE